MDIQGNGWPKWEVGGQRVLKVVINLVLAKLNSRCQPYEAIVKVVELKEKKIKKKKR